MFRRLINVTFALIYVMIVRCYNMSDTESKSLLIKFNNRDSIAYGKVYGMFYDELYHFAMKLYRESDLDVGDTVQDIFIAIWENNKLEFSNLFEIKAYIYVSIKNKLKNYIKHQKCVDKYKQAILDDNDFFIVEVAESETYSLVKYAISLLPKDCAQVMRYYLEGYDVKDIANKLSMPERTIYNKKAEAISILKKKNILKHFVFMKIIIN